MADISYVEDSVVFKNDDLTGTSGSYLMLRMIKDIIFSFPHSGSQYHRMFHHRNIAGLLILLLV